MNQFKEINLANIAGGAATELFQRELAIVAKNIADLNTEAKKARKITLTVTFTPDEARQEVKMNLNAKSSIASVKPASKTIHMAKINGKDTFVGNDPQQTEFNFTTPGVTPLTEAKNA